MSVDCPQPRDIAGLAALLRVRAESAAKERARLSWRAQYHILGTAEMSVEELHEVADVLDQVDRLQVVVEALRRSARHAMPENSHDANSYRRAVRIPAMEWGDVVAALNVLEALENQHPPAHPPEPGNGE